ncbi:ComF family protein [Curvibacter sp. CHRR-16]|uniref:ComF family protein n=1 Tax=Curvibacter sp. CHRR-16 TaxID=2835872 RepID=UPI001BDA8980|nr:phosphoribosyltransferase family protein [Curvibacter sp. CHRR-16]MBT0571770.1 ComF family protein [Curvibacter sp. CHRR-16]
MFQRLAKVLPHGSSLWTDHLPSQCQFCHAWPSQRVCHDCLQRFAPPTPRCLLCAMPLDGPATPLDPATPQRCRHCAHQPLPAWDTALAALPYAAPWSRALQAFKFEQHTGWASYWGQRLAHTLHNSPHWGMLQTQHPWAVAVPLSDERLRERGYDQSALLAAQLARRLPALRHRPRMLLRPHATALQHSLGREQRLINLVGAFAVDPLHQPQLQGQAVVLVDDIMTTGATCEAAAQALRQAGVAHITVLVVARTPV